MTWSKSHRFAHIRTVTAKHRKGDQSMAYRFLLEVPEYLAYDARTAISMTDDAQVLVERASHGLGFGVPYVDLSVAAHSLTVVGNLYTWCEDAGILRPDNRTVVRLVSHSGKRLAFHEHTRGEMISAVRYDQPWTERSIPKIGDHEQDSFIGVAPTAYGSGPSRAEQPEPTPPAIEETGTSGAAVAIANPPTGAVHGGSIEAADDRLTIGGLNTAIVHVAELSRPEDYYLRVFGFELIGRMRRGEDGAWEELDHSYDHQAARKQGTEADMVILRNGVFQLGLSRAGRSLPLGYEHISNRFTIEMHPEDAARLRADALMNSRTVLDSTPDTLTFRDPYGVVWTVNSVEA